MSTPGCTTPNHIEIRDVEVEDLSRGLFEVYSQLTKAPRLSEERMRDVVTELNSDPNRRLLVAVKGDSVLATGSLIIEQKLLRNAAKCAHIEDIVVHSDARGQNLGRRIVTQLVNIAKAENCYKVILDCSTENVPFYEKCGFVKKEVQMAQYF